MIPSPSHSWNIHCYKQTLVNVDATNIIVDIIILLSRVIIDSKNLSNND